MRVPAEAMLVAVSRAGGVAVGIAETEEVLCPVLLDGDATAGMWIRLGIDADGRIRGTEV